jgi:tape measure domain-containing protein
MAKSDLSIRIGTDLRNFRTGLNGAFKDLKRFGFKAESIGRDLSTRVSLPILAIGAAAVKTFAEFDRMEKGLSALSGGAAGGAAAFKRLNAIVLDTRTTLDLKTAALGEQRLVGAGRAALDAERTIKALGITATVSGSAIDDVGGVLRQFTQILGKGKIEQEDMNSILDRMPALGAVIKQEFGASTAEGIRATGISMESFVERVTTAIEKNKDFQNVQGGLAKSFESFANAVQVGIKPMGEAIAKSLNLEENLARLGNFVGRASQAFADLNPNVQKFIVFTAAGAAAVGPLTFGLGAAAKSLPLLVSGFKLLSGPIGKLVSVVPFLGSTFKLLFAGGSIGRAIVLTKVVTGLKFAFAAMTGPVGLIVIGLAALAIGFKRAYDRSGFFRGQVAKLGEMFTRLGTQLSGLISKVLPDLGGAFKSVGSVFDGVLSVLAGGVSAFVSILTNLVESISLVVGAISDVLDGEFSNAGEKLGKTIFAPGGFIKAAADAAKAASTTFNQTLEYESPAISEDEKIEQSGNRKKAGGARQSPEAISELSAFVPSTISDEARDGIAKYFNEFVVGSRNVEFLQGKLANLSATPVTIGQPDRLVRTREVLSEIAEEIRGNLGNAFADIDIKGQLFGNSFDTIGEKISATKESMLELSEQGFAPTSDAMAVLIEKYKELKKEKEDLVKTTDDDNEKLKTTASLYESLGIKFDETFQGFSEGQKALATGIALVSNIATSAFNDMASGAKNFAASLGKATRSIVGNFIKQGVASVVSGALTNASFLGPLAIPIGAVAGAGANALFQGLLTSLNIPALAKGGVATGPQLALIGEAGPEAVVPLDRLENMINMGGNDGSDGGQVTFRIAADELIGILDRHRPNYNRA